MEKLFLAVGGDGSLRGAWYYRPHGWMVLGVVKKTNLYLRDGGVEQARKDPSNHGFSIRFHDRRHCKW